MAEVHDYQYGGSGEHSAVERIPRTVLQIAELLGNIGLRVYIIGARALMLHGVGLQRETRDWDVTITAPFTRELRDRITGMLRSKGFKVQWRKWGLLVEDDIHVDINYAPLILDEEWEARAFTHYRKRLPAEHRGPGDP
ncbi:hypothetical protein [Pyrodictium abyssi]|uniref:Nucleotidyltransferase family protein n=1 Tax=Pyrodictium abyssi TaxID=54256 RepID=A0ABN6ZSS7_9CREN|nr:hypothetical protein PABY_01450 [Pyrodictium abyssi]